MCLRVDSPMSMHRWHPLLHLTRRRIASCRIESQFRMAPSNRVLNLRGRAAERHPLDLTIAQLPARVACQQLIALVVDFQATIAGNRGADRVQTDGCRRVFQVNSQLTRIGRPIGAVSAALRTRTGENFGTSGPACDRQCGDLVSASPFPKAATVTPADDVVQLAFPMRNRLVRSLFVGLKADRAIDDLYRCSSQSLFDGSITPSRSWSFQTTPLMPGNKTPAGRSSIPWKIGEATPVGSSIVRISIWLAAFGTGILIQCCLERYRTTPRSARRHHRRDIRRD